VRWKTTDQEANAVLDRAARGDTSALPAVREILRDPNVLAVYGDVGRIARDEVIAAGAGTDLTAAEAMRRGAAAVEAGLLADAGGAATAAERLAAARAATGWVTVHVLEALRARRPPGSPAAAAIEKHLASAERRYQAALKAVLVLRRLRGPGVGVQVSVSAGPMVVDNAGWDRAKCLAVPPNVRLHFLPPCTPERQPVEPFWALVREAVANETYHRLADLRRVIRRRCRRLPAIGQPSRGRSGSTGRSTWKRKASTQDGKSRCMPMASLLANWHLLPGANHQAPGLLQASLRDLRRV